MNEVLKKSLRLRETELITDCKKNHNKECHKISLFI
jgi:hypothetical protein